MIGRWRGEILLADQEFLAALYEVSVRTVRRYCTPVDHDRRTRAPLYDAFAAQHQLEPIQGRPYRTAAAVRARAAQLRDTA